MLPGLWPREARPGQVVRPAMVRLSRRCNGGRDLMSNCVLCLGTGTRRGGADQQFSEMARISAGLIHSVISWMPEPVRALR